ncbi:MAG: histidine-type phosphatase [Paludibacteraceae bacterium]|nr:histidine-type phosphatase [Paludibacteraceae bacterium]
MNKFLLIFASLFVSIVVTAKTAREEIYENINLSGGGYLTYPEPIGVEYTKVPKGYTPFYISSYHRHGSRFLIGKEDYVKPQQLLHKADSLGLLTAEGKKVMGKVDSVCALAKDRYGELTNIGFKQHKGVAQRMYNNFPDVFKGNKTIDARSTDVIRSILSMFAETSTLIANNPKLNLFIDASAHDMYYMNHWFNPINKTYGNLPEVKECKNNFAQKHTHPERLINELFKSYPYTLSHLLNKNKTYISLWEIASNLQNIDTDIDMMYLFTKEECYENWSRSNVGWYLECGPSIQTKQMKPYVHSNLLRNIIETADKAIESDTIAATMRFGHDSVVLPLTILMHLNNFYYVTGDMESLADNWHTYDIIPMACNIQLIFFKSKKSDNPVLVKIMLNERECHIPIEPYSDVYYEWDKVKDYYLNNVLKNIPVQE